MYPFTVNYYNFVTFILHKLLLMSRFELVNSKTNPKRSKNSDNYYFLRVCILFIVPVIRFLDANIYCAYFKVNINNNLSVRKV